MTLEELRAKHKDDILRITGEYGITNVRVFGSVVRGEADDDSDIDLLVTLPPKISWRVFECRRELENEISLPIDLVGDRGLDKYLSPFILSEATPL